MVQQTATCARGISQVLSNLSINHSEASESAGPPSSEDGSLLSDGVEACQLNECTGEANPIQRQRIRQRRNTLELEEKSKAVVDPRKYKTKLCRNWKASGTCPYEHTCCYAHGELETRTMHQNNNVLSSLGYFSGIMLLAMKDEKSGGKGMRGARKSMQPRHAQANASAITKAPEPEGEPASPLMHPTTPTVHSPYCLPGDGPSFGVESEPASPLSFTDTQMPSYSLRMEAGYPKSPSFGYEAPEYCFMPPAMYPYPPMGAYGPCYPIAPAMGYDLFALPDSHELPYERLPLEAQQAAMEKHPALRHLHSGEMSQKQLQKVLQDIMYTPAGKQRKPRRPLNATE